VATNGTAPAAVARWASPSRECQPGERSSREDCADLEGASAEPKQETTVGLCELDVDDSEHWKQRKKYQEAVTNGDQRQEQAYSHTDTEQEHGPEKLSAAREGGVCEEPDTARPKRRHESEEGEPGGASDRILVPE
jgi:hypothetical protein